MARRAMGSAVFCSSWENSATLCKKFVSICPAEEFEHILKVRVRRDDSKHGLVWIPFGSWRQFLWR
jgi:hypothetical protein